MADKLILEGEEVELGAAVVAITLQSNDITKPESIQANYSNSIQIPPTQKNRRLLGFADQVNSGSAIPYKVLDARIFKDGVEVVPKGKGELLNGSFELDIYSGNRNFFDQLGDKSIQDLDLSEFNHTWNFGTIQHNAANSNWQQGYVYDLYDRGKGVNLNAVDCFSLYPSVFARQVWERIFKEAGFTYTGFEHPMLDKLLLPLTELFEFNEEYKKARQFRVTNTVDGVYERIAHDTVVVRYNSVKSGYGVDTNGGFQLANSRYVIDQPRIMTFSAGVRVGLRTLSGSLEGKLSIRVNDQDIAASAFTNPIGDHEVRYLTVSSEPRLMMPGDVVEVKLRVGDNTDLQVQPRWYIYYNATGSETPYFSGTVLGEFPKGGQVELAQWLPDISQKDFIKSIVQLFGLTFQTELFRDTIKINTFSKVIENIPNAINISNWVHHPESIRPSFKFGDFAQGNKISWQEDDTVKKGFNNGEILIADTTLEAEKVIIELPYAATEKLGELLSLPMWKAKYDTNPVQYDEQSIKPRLVVQGPDSMPFTLVEYAANGTDIKTSRPVESPLAYHVDASKDYDLNIQEYIIPTFYPTLLAILDGTKVLTVQVKTPAQFIQDFDQSVPVWVDYWQNYFYINKINEFINSHSLTEWELVRL
ncbi:hypothetical protein [Adhaeribacter aquaticus]|uniref:hypothetical protein n=1 Tax=Adhaeribacter aquaticus TaxID=299567 RepID=UPI0003FD82B2|nr:hypothetical protein [Adhaeribacter aquaticus]